MTFSSLQSLLPRAARKYGVEKTLRAIGICKEAEKALAEIFCKHEHAGVKPKSYSAGILKVTVENSGWAQEVFTHRVKILNRINTQLGRKAVRSIKITTKTA